MPNELPWTQYAESAYSAFCNSLSSVVHEPWEHLSVAEQTAWEASVRQSASELAGGNQVVDPATWTGWQRPVDRPENQAAVEEPAEAPVAEAPPEPPAA